MRTEPSGAPVQAVDYDAVWKEVLQHLFRDCLALLFPDVEGMIDWAFKPTFLNVELPKLVPAVRRGMRRPDLVAQVHLRDHQPALIVLHAEIQVSPDPEFAERMFVYFYHLRERFQVPVMSLAILADSNPRWRPNRYEYRLGGTAVRFEYSTVKLLDLDENTLQESGNPIAFFIQAHMASLKYRGNYALLAEEKKRLFRRMLEKGYNSIEIRYLYQVVDYLMSLPYDLEREVEAVIEEIRRRRRRKWIAPQERLAVERALREGLEEGRQQGFQEGIQEGIQQVILNLLQARFGTLSDELHQLIRTVQDIETLNQLSILSAQVETLDQFVAKLQSIIEEEQSRS